jgi:hypothetical protein
LVIETRKTYRAVLSEPVVVIPTNPSLKNKSTQESISPSLDSTSEKTIVSPAPAEATNPNPTPTAINVQAGQNDSKKRPREEDITGEVGRLGGGNAETATNSGSKKKKKKLQGS